jgi:hypothetical protein
MDRACARFQEMLPDYSVDMLDERTHNLVSEHLAVCSDCRAELVIQESVMSLVETHGVREPPPGLFNAVRNRIESAHIAQAAKPWWSFLWTAPVRGLALVGSAAVLVLGLMMPVSTPHIPEGSLHPSLDIGRASASSELANSIRQHAMSAAEGPLAERVAWEAMAQLAESPDLDGENGKSRTRSFRERMRPAGLE